MTGQSVLGEGDTPLIDLGDALSPGVRIRVKAEYLNPTGSFKDRIAAVATTRARKAGMRGLLGTSSGNGGAAAAAYAAHLGLELTLLALPTTPPAKLSQVLATGARVHLVDGLGTDPQQTRQIAKRISSGSRALGYEPFLTGGDFCPEIMSGADAVGRELAWQGSGPVYVPVGGGGLLAALRRGLREAGASDRALVAVQPQGCATLKDALDGGEGSVPVVTTAISGLQVATLFDHDAPEAVRASKGWLRTVTDESVYRAQAELARRGILVEPAGATAVAGVVLDAATGILQQGSEVVAVATGAGWKDGESLRRLGGSPSPTPGWVEELVG